MFHLFHKKRHIFFVKAEISYINIKFVSVWCVSFPEGSNCVQLKQVDFEVFLNIFSVCFCLTRTDVLNVTLE